MVTGAEVAVLIFVSTIALLVMIGVPKGANVNPYPEQYIVIQNDYIADSCLHRTKLDAVKHVHDVLIPKINQGQHPKLEFEPVGQCDMEGLHDRWAARDSMITIYLEPVNYIENLRVNKR